jgi:hypothetical protein
MFKRHRLLAAAAAVAASATVALTGLTAASASPARAAASGTEHLQLMSTSATSNLAPIIIYGVVTAQGVDHEGSGNTDTVKFAGGSFKLVHSAGKGTQHFNPVTCLAQISQHGTYKISGGTGKYKGISGHGKYQFNILAVGKKVKGKCSQKAAPVAFQQLIQASGPVSL